MENTKTDFFTKTLNGKVAVAYDREQAENVLAVRLDGDVVQKLMLGVIQPNPEDYMFTLLKGCVLVLRPDWLKEKPLHELKNIVLSDYRKVLIDKDEFILSVEPNLFGGMVLTSQQVGYIEEICEYLDGVLYEGIEGAKFIDFLVYKFLNGSLLGSKNEKKVLNELNNAGYKGEDVREVANRVVHGSKVIKRVVGSTLTSVYLDNGAFELEVDLLELVGDTDMKFNYDFKLNSSQKLFAKAVSDYLLYNEGLEFATRNLYLGVKIGLLRLFHTANTVF